MSAPKKFRGYDFTVTDWLAICEMHGNRCASCGEEKPLTVDHIKPRVAGGTDSLDNIQPLCLSCNSSKSATHEGVNLKRTREVTKPGRFEMRISEDDSQLLDALADFYGCNRASVYSMALRLYAEQEDVRDALAKASKPASEE
jgi:hypothetical protein